MRKKKLIIIGGGAAGLMAAMELSNDYEILIIDAAEHAGGRIQSIKNPAGYIEAGAEFIHGNAELTFKLLKKAGIEYVPVEGNFYRKERGYWQEEDEFIEGWDLLMKKLKQLKNDTTLKEFLNKEFSDDKYANLRKQVRGFAEGFDVADISRVSAKSLYEEWSKGQDENYRIPSGYCGLIEYLKTECEKSGCKFLFNTIVKQIDWEKDQVTVMTRNGEKFNSDKLLVTVSLEILKKNRAKAAINFTPPIDEYIKATELIGIGSVIKIILHFAQPIWKPDTGFILSDEAIPTWWTQLPDNRPILTGWAGGSRADLLSKETDEALLEKGLISLAFIFEKPLEEIKKLIIQSNVFNWKNNELVMGGYSYSTPQSHQARKTLNTPLANTVFFAGEALYEGDHPGTVEAALQSGRDAAKKIKG